MAKKHAVENEPDIVDAHVVDGGDGVPGAELVPVAPVPHEIALHAGIATLALTPEQTAIIRAPIAEAEIDFRWGDKAKSYALAYAPQVMMRKRLCEAFPGTWGLRVLRAFTSEEDGGSKVLLHGALYIQGRFVAEAMGEATYLGDVNKGASYATAWESAKSDCLGRCCKDLGMFAELWDRKFTKPLERAWMKANKKKCPKCGKDECLMQDKADETRWFCWMKKGGCGWEGTPPEEPEARSGGPAGPGAPVAQAITPRPAPSPAGPPAPARATTPTPTAGGSASPLQTAGGPGIPPQEREATGNVNAALDAFLGKQAEPPPFEEWMRQNTAAGMVEDLTATHLRIALSNKSITDEERALAQQFILTAKDKQKACSTMVERLQQLAAEREGVDADLAHIQPRTHAHRVVRGRRS